MDKMASDMEMGDLVREYIVAALLLSDPAGSQYAFNVAADRAHRAVEWLVKEADWLAGHPRVWDALRSDSDAVARLARISKMAETAKLMRDYGAWGVGQRETGNDRIR